MQKSTERQPPDAGACLEALGACAFVVAGFMLGPFEGVIAIGVTAWTLAIAFAIRRPKREVSHVDTD